MTRKETHTQQVRQLLKDLNWQNIQLSSYWHSGFRDDMLDVKFDRLYQALTSAPRDLLQASQVVTVLCQIADANSQWWADFWNMVDTSPLYGGMRWELSFDERIRSLAREVMSRTRISEGEDYL